MDRMNELIKILNEASKSYYQLSRTIMSDYEYDKLYDELLKLESDTGVVMSDSPTQNVGYEVLSSLKKVKHDSKMLSLDKTKDIEKLKSFIGDNECILSWKLDGLTIVLKYDNGELVQAVTRGNGEVGEDITHNAKMFKNIPLKISFKYELIVRGEGLIGYSDFKEINSELDDTEKYKNPRNLCSGTVRQLNNEIVAKRNVNFYVFTLVKAEGRESSGLKSDNMKWLESLGFDVVESSIVYSDTIEESVNDFKGKIDKNDFASDGLVLTYNSIEYSESLGKTSKFPKDSIAFKWADETAETTLKTIYWSTSRTGLINPIAIFEPVELEGTTVERASVHNVSMLEELKLNEGDRITVYKANMIIPQIAENITKTGPAPIPEHCPVCGGDTEIRSIKEGRALYCINPTCRAQLVLSLSHFASRNAMNIDGLSEKTIEKFVEKGFLNNYTDIYNLQSYAEEIRNFEGFGEKSYNNLINAIESSKTVRLYNFIYGLGINNVGLSNAKLLCKNYNDDLDKIISANEEELIDIDGFGEVIAKSIKIYFNDTVHLELLDKIRNKLNFIKEYYSEQNSFPLEGKTFVITGDLEHFENRKALQEKIEQLGGKATNSVTKRTSYLINNDILSNSSKNKKASELNIPVITEKQFIDMFLNI